GRTHRGRATETKLSWINSRVRSTSSPFAKARIAPAHSLDVSAGLAIRAATRRPQRYRLRNMWCGRVVAAAGRVRQTGRSSVQVRAGRRARRLRRIARRIDHAADHREAERRRERVGDPRIVHAVDAGDHRAVAVDTLVDDAVVIEI